MFGQFSSSRAACRLARSEPRRSIIHTLSARRRVPKEGRAGVKKVMMGVCQCPSLGIPMWENVFKVPLDIARIVGVVFVETRTGRLSADASTRPVKKPSQLCSNSAGPAALLHTCTQHSRTAIRLSSLRSACPKRVRRERHPSPDVCDNGYLLWPVSPRPRLTNGSRRFGEFSGSSGEAETPALRCTEL